MTDLRELTVHEFAAMRDSGTAHKLLDVRESWELAIAMIADSVHIPMNEIPSRLDALPTDMPLVVICHAGIRSAHVAAWLGQQGFSEVYNLAGGIDLWAAEIDRTMGRY